jgi:hypothetical protein
MKQKLDFYDLKKKKKFSTNDYKFIVKKTQKGIKHFAIATAPSGIKSWRVIADSFYKNNK